MTDGGVKAVPHQHCPECGSDKIKIVKYLGMAALICEKCTYDEREEIESIPEERGTQREKRRYSPYRSGRPVRGK